MKYPTEEEYLEELLKQARAEKPREGQYIRDLESRLRFAKKGMSS